MGGLAACDNFVANLASFATSPLVPKADFALWRVRWILQDGTQLAPAGQLVTPLDVWYLSQLLEGMSAREKS